MLSTVTDIYKENTNEFTMTSITYIQTPVQENYSTEQYK